MKLLCSGSIAYLLILPFLPGEPIFTSATFKVKKKICGLILTHVSYNLCYLVVNIGQFYVMMIKKGCACWTQMWSQHPD